MRERLDAADLRFLTICLLLLGGTVWFAAANFHRAFPEASIDFRVSRTDARAIAERFLAGQGQPAAGYRTASRFSYDESAKTFLERELGLEEANRIMGGRVRLWRWSHRWFRAQQKEEFRVEVTPRGDVVGWEHALPEAAPRPAATPEQARALAEDFLRTRVSRDPAALDFVESADVARPSRTDRVFTWKEREFNVRDATYRFQVTVLGNEVGGYNEYLKVPEAWSRDYGRMRSKNVAAQSVDTAVMLLLVVGLLATIVARVRTRDVHWGRAALVGAIGAGLFFLSSCNSFPLDEFNYPTTDSYASFLARRLLQYVLGALASGGLLFALTAGAEPLYRQFFGGQISLGNLFRPRSLRTKAFFKGTVLGLALTGIFVAYQTAFYLVAYHYGAWSPADVPYDDLLNTRFPWLFVLFGGFLPAVSEEFLFRMFAVPWLRKVTRSVWAAVILAGFIWGFGHAGYPQQPFWIRGVEVGIGGVALGLILLRWGILPTLVWHYSVDALYTALLLLRSHNPYFILSGALSAGIMVLPAVLAFLAYLRGGGFQAATGLTNASEGSAAPPAEEIPEAPGAVAAYRAWPARRRAGAVALFAAGLLCLVIPTVRFGDKPRFALDQARARAAADAFLLRQGLRPQAFSTVVFPVNRWQDEDEWRPRQVGKYFLERRPVGYLAQAFRSVIPLQVWVVRYYRPLEKEEVRVSVHPETGVIMGFQHQLPEDRAGADLNAGAARKLAGDFLVAHGYDLNPLELKETNSERQKARRDHVLVWEARAGDPRNLDQAHYRVRVAVAGDRVTAFGSSWKLPETFLRERQRRTVLSNLLLLLRVSVMTGGVVLGLWLLILYTRRRVLRWRQALLAGVPMAVLGLAGALVALPLVMRGYDTAIPLETFRAMEATGLIMAAVGLFLSTAATAGVLLSLYPAGFDVLGRSYRRAAGLDALLAAAAALGLTVILSQTGWMLRDTFHAQALLPASTPDGLGTLVPAVAVVAGAAEETLFGLAVLAMAVFLAVAVHRRALLGAGALAVLAALVPSDVHTAGEFAMHYALLLVGAAAALVFVRGFARGNLLAYIVAFWTVAMTRRALDLFAQPGSRADGWISLAILAATLLWVLGPSLGAGVRAKEAVGVV